MRKEYPSDVSRKQFEEIRPILENARKKVSGIKRHIAVDTQGLPHAIHITTANITDREGALLMFKAEFDIYIAVFVPLLHNPHNNNAPFCCDFK